MPRLGICSSSMGSSVQALITELGRISGVQIIFIRLPYNDLDQFRLTPGTCDGAVLCHSIYNRRFAITDVTDALYDEFLPHAADVLGRENVAVIAHDFLWPISENPPDHMTMKLSQMDDFRSKQPTTFRRSGLTLISGRLDTTVQMDGDDMQRLHWFVNQIRPTVFDWKTNLGSAANRVSGRPIPGRNHPHQSSTLFVALVSISMLLLYFFKTGVDAGIDLIGRFLDWIFRRL